MHLPASGCKARLAWLVLALLTTLSSVAGADIIRAFDTRASFDQRGDIQLVGNTLLTCTGSGCAAIQNGTDTGGNAHNGNRNMVYVNVDAMAGFPNSSSADLVLPPGATVQFAGLYWGARAAQTSTTRGDIRFRVPGTPGYHAINARGGGHGPESVDQRLLSSLPGHGRRHRPGGCGRFRHLHRCRPDRQQR